MAISGKWLALGGGALLAIGAACTTAAAQDAAQGQQLFKTQCALCHSVEPGKNTLGPSLAKIVGRRAGTLPNYAFSPAMKGSKLTWDRATLDTYLTNPRQTVPGTKMTYVGQRDAAKRAALVAYLASLR